METFCIDSELPESFRKCPESSVLEIAAILCKGGREAGGRASRVLARRLFVNTSFHY